MTEIKNIYLQSAKIIIIKTINNEAPPAIALIITIGKLPLSKCMLTGAVGIDLSSKKPPKPHIKYTPPK